MSGTIDHIAEMLKTLSADVKQLKIDIANLKEDNHNSAVSAGEAYSALNTKIDLLKNLNNESAAAIQQAAVTKTAKQCRPAYFKTIYAEDSKKYLGTLYSQEDIDTVMRDEKVAKSKSQAIQSNRVANILYNQYIKPDKTRMAAFEEIYSKHFNN